MSEFEQSSKRGSEELNLNLSFRPSTDPSSSICLTEREALIVNSLHLDACEEFLSLLTPSLADHKDTSVAIRMESMLSVLKMFVDRSYVIHPESFMEKENPECMYFTANPDSSELRADPLFNQIQWDREDIPDGTAITFDHIIDRNQKQYEFLPIASALADSIGDILPHAYESYLRTFDSSITFEEWMLLIAQKVSTGSLCEAVRYPKAHWFWSVVLERLPQQHEPIKTLFDHLSLRGGVIVGFKSTLLQKGLFYPNEDLNELGIDTRKSIVTKDDIDRIEVLGEWEDSLVELLRHRW